MPDHYLAPDWVTRKIFNRLVSALARLGLSARGSRVLEVRGRKTGETRHVPVNLLHFEGQRYLVAPRGETEWVRNVRADSGKLALVLGRKREELTATEIPDSDKVPVLRAYLKLWKAETGKFFGGVGPESSDGELAGIASRHPVFLLSAG